MAGFDLNIGRILPNWTIADALREIIANAWDEQCLTRTRPIEIIFTAPDQVIIRDYGRGIKIPHLIQNENLEKTQNDFLLGSFGVGLKDALAIFAREKIKVQIVSQHFILQKLIFNEKRNFEQVHTLHAMVTTPGQVTLTGTEITLQGVTQNDVQTAQNFFLQFRNLTLLHENRYGQIFAKNKSTDPTIIFINGLAVNTEERFYFHYNITKKDHKIKQAMNRERSHISRQAYAGRIKKILVNCDDTDLLKRLWAEFKNMSSGQETEEVHWKEVQLYLIKNLTNKDHLTVSQNELLTHADVIARARQEGKEIIIVPDNLVQNLTNTNLFNYVHVDLEQFAFQWTVPEELTQEEQEIFTCSSSLLRIWSTNTSWMQQIEIKISENMPTARIKGIWKSSDLTIIIIRSALASISEYAGVLLTQLIYAKTNQKPIDPHIEQELMLLLGTLALPLLSAH